MTEQPLATVAVGSRATVTRLEAAGPLRRRLLEMGFVPGCEIAIRNKAAFGGPIVCDVLGYRLALRREHATQIHVLPAAAEAGA